MSVQTLLEVFTNRKNGYETLSTIRDIYYGDISEIPALEKETRSILQDYDIISHDLKPTLTSNGYIVGNICKEYCNWVDNGREMPPPKPPVEYYLDRKVLDLGCSFGRWLWEFKDAKQLVGIELESGYVEAANVLSRKESKKTVTIINASVEELEKFIQPQSIDFVFSRLVFNHVWITDTLRQTRECLAEGGMIWLQVENFRFPLKILRNEKRLKGKLRALFSLFNTVWFQIFRKQICLRIKGRMHSEHKTVYPSAKVWRKELEKAGFVGITTTLLETAYVFVGKID